MRSFSKCQPSARSIADGEVISQMSPTTPDQVMSLQEFCESALTVLTRSGTGRTKLSGDAKSPTISDSEKLIVARVDNVAPKKMREKDCMVCSCCELASRKRTRSAPR